MDAELEREAIRVYRRYSAEVVEALGICPWAAKARRDGRVREHVLVEPVADVAAATAVVCDMGRDPTVEIGLLLFPRVALDRAGFESFVAQVRDAYAAEVPRAVEMALAAFHPRADADVTGPERLVPFLRRTPDPTIQLVRRTALAAVRRSHGHGTGFVDPAEIDFATFLASEPRIPLHERVAQTNLQTVERLGVEQLEALLEEIRRDRDAAYARLGVD